MAGLSRSVRPFDLRSTRAGSGGHGSDEHPNTRDDPRYSHLGLDCCKWGWYNVVPVINPIELLATGMVNDERYQRSDRHCCSCAKYAIASPSPVSLLSSK